MGIRKESGIKHDLFLKDVLVELKLVLNIIFSVQLSGQNHYVHFMFQI